MCRIASEVFSRPDSPTWPTRSSVWPAHTRSPPANRPLDVPIPRTRARFGCLTRLAAKADRAKAGESRRTQQPSRAPIKANGGRSPRSSELARTTIRRATTGAGAPDDLIAADEAGRGPGPSLAHALLAKRLEDAHHEGRQVVGRAAGDDVAIPHASRVHPDAAGVLDVVANRVRSQSPSCPSSSAPSTASTARGKSPPAPCPAWRPPSPGRSSPGTASCGRASSRRE